jgi:hypothetical protein
MFISTQNNLLDKENRTSAFLKAVGKESAKTLSANGALKYSTTGNDFVDQFGSMGHYKAPRDFADIFRDTSILWAQDPELTVKFILFLRMITRTTKTLDNITTKETQRGAGLRHEGIVRMIWLHLYHPEVFWKNIGLFISVGSWKDIITMLSYDLKFHGWENRALDWESMGKLILAGLENRETCELVKKYLPQIKASRKCKTPESIADTVIAKWLCSKFYGNKNSVGTTYKSYRKLKTSGTAHEWQQLISQGKHDQVNFDSVHGRALAQMVSSKYLENQGQSERFNQWIDTKPVAKFTGYPYELFKTLPSKSYQIKTLNAQFMQLVETAKKNALITTDLIVVRDTSYSMTNTAVGADVSCDLIAKSLALFFSHMLKGAFSDSWIEFSRDAKLHQWKGSNPYEKFINDRASVIGNTDFMSVIRLFAKIKESGVPESEFPSGILCISDGEFDPSGLDDTNVSAARDMLRKAGFSKEFARTFQIILWNLPVRRTNTKYETYETSDYTFYFSGYDPSIISFLTGMDKKSSQVKTPEELFVKAMDQQILNMVKI